MVLQAIMKRKSVRDYNDIPVSDNVIKEILNAGRMAPSWVNVQPWKFIVVKSEETKELLYKASGNQKQIKQASAIICCIADLTAWEKRNFAAVMEKQGKNLITREFILSSPALNPSLLGEYETLLRTVEQLPYAIGYMTLRAQDLGVGCCIIGALANEVSKSDENLIHNIKTKLNLNEKQILLSLLTLGYENNPIEITKSRKEFDEIVSFEKLGEKFE